MIFSQQFNHNNDAFEAIEIAFSQCIVCLKYVQVAQHQVLFRLLFSFVLSCLFSPISLPLFFPPFILYSFRFVSEPDHRLSLSPHILTPPHLLNSIANANGKVAGEAQKFSQFPQLQQTHTHTHKL